MKFEKVIVFAFIILHAPRLLTSAFSTFLIFHTPHFLHSTYSTEPANPIKINAFRRVPLTAKVGFRD